MKHPDECECEGTGIVERAGFRVTCSKHWVTREEADAILAEERQAAAEERHRQASDERRNDIQHYYEQLIIHAGMRPSEALDLADLAVDYWDEKMGVASQRAEGEEG